MSHSIKSRDDSELSNRISGELLALITNSKSMVFKKREELFKTILDNRTFSNFR
jgi:ribosomal protein S7